ncbi:hypothetical protein JTB14_011748 [Gonioctena quinquepunctata]|nr:hypothetical protein JTB14_011748 [Gonioctena quinquepunctata]
MNILLDKEKDTICDLLAKIEELKKLTNEFYQTTSTQTEINNPVSVLVEPVARNTNFLENSTAAQLLKNVNSADYLLINEKTMNATHTSFRVTIKHLEVKLSPVKRIQDQELL